MINQEKSLNFVFLSYRKNFIGTQKRVRIIQGKRAIGVQGIEVLLYIHSTPVISNSFISIYRLSPSDNLVPVLHRNLTTGNKIFWKKGEIALKEQQCISNFRNQVTYSFVKCGCSIYFFLNFANLICRGMDILKYSTMSLVIRESAV